MRAAIFGARRTAPVPPPSRRRPPASRLGTLLRTTAFRLTLAYLVIFFLFAGLVLGYVAWNARNLLNEQIRNTIEAEINGLAEQYRIGGIRRVVVVVEQRSRAPGASSTSSRISPASGWSATSRRCRPARSTGRATGFSIMPVPTTRRASPTARSCACRSCRAASAC